LFDCVWRQQVLDTSISHVLLVWQMMHTRVPSWSSAPHNPHAE
jgi:hypothetical protein